MPQPLRYALIWSHEHKHYTLTRDGQPEQGFLPADQSAFSGWLDEHTAFAFLGQAGRISVLKEARRGGTGYWYAHRTQHRHTRKCYLGRTTQVTFARLEEVAQRLTSSSSPALAKTALLSSKFAPPQLPLSLVPRSRLLRELDAVHTHPLTLVSASAGSGKTTLLSAWVASARQSERLWAAGREPALAWLALEALDDGPIRFWDAVIAAVRTCLPRVGKAVLAMLHQPSTPPLSTLLTHLLNEIGEGGRELILVLDDYHVIQDQIIHESLLFFIDHLPPTLHLVLISRTDPELPLSRLRVRGQLIEIRSGDLRFTREEATDFLLQRMGLPLSGEDITTLHRRTEGWAAGLQLAALFLRKQQDLSQWISNFAGSHRYLLDYVQQDILVELPVPLQHFLLQTSILTRMNAAVCQAVTAVPGEPASQEMLEALERANLFLVPLDSERQWYRYHDLFREALRARLHASQPELVPLLHGRAARWYEAQGEWRESITHALAAPDYPLAASLMEQAAPVLWLSGEASVVQNWVLTLPDPVLCVHARLALNAALRFLNSVHISTETVHASMAVQVQRTIMRMEAILRGQEAQVLSPAEIAMIERRLCLLRALVEVRAIMGRGDKERLRLLTQELEALPPDDEVSWKLIPLSFAFWLALSLQQSSALLVEELRAARQWISEAGDHLVTFRVMTWLATAYLEAGQLQQAYRECLSALTLLEQISGGTPVAGYLLFALFNVSYAWNRLEEASDVLHRLRRIAQDWQQVELLMIGERSAARLALARGDLSTAQEALQRAEALFEREDFANNVRWMEEIRVRIWLAQGNLAEASTWAPLRKWEVLLLARVALAQQKPAQAVETLERFSWHQDQPADIEKTLEWLALHVVSLFQAGKVAQARTAAARLLAMTEPEGYIRVYLDAGFPMKQALKMLLESPLESDSSTAAISPPYVLRLLATFEQEESRRTRRSEVPPPATKALPHPPQNTLPRRRIEPLSRQEQQVLRLLVGGSTYAEMAEALVVSPNTIKTQVSSIYRKLGVSRRAEAIAITQQLHLL
jgi:LuxR family maltose regulon positive regulatory protein